MQERAGHDRRQDPSRSATASSWSRPRTRSSRRAPTRCPRRSSTASCSRSGRLPARDEEREIVTLHGHRTAMPRSTTSASTPVARPGRARRPRARRCAALRLSDEIVDYIVDLVRATREHADAPAAAPRRARPTCWRGRRARLRRARRARLRDPRRRQGSWPCPPLRHRVVLAPGAEIEGLTTEPVVRSRSLDAGAGAAMIACPTRRAGA